MFSYKDKFIFKLYFSTFLVFIYQQNTLAENIILPPETGVFKEANLPGYIVALQKCLICHSQDYVQYQPPSMTRLQWEGEIKKMKVHFKAPITDEEIPILTEYFAKVYGAEQSSFNKEKNR